MPDLMSVFHYMEEIWRLVRISFVKLNVTVLVTDGKIFHDQNTS
jgi:hypothetical protein